MAQFNLGRVKGDKGDKGAQGVSFSFKGEWKSGVAYKNDEITIDVVSYLGSAYACKVSHTSTADNGPSNTTNWGILLSNAFDLVQTDTINDPAKVPSSAVTHALGQEIDTLNNNLGDVSSQLAESAAQIQTFKNSKADKTEVDTERQRINNLVANAGDTDNNAELLDIRVGAHSRIYRTAGEAVRAIGKNFKNSINLLNPNTTTPNQAIRFNTGEVVSSELYFTTDYIAVRPGHVLIVTKPLPHPTPIQGVIPIESSYRYAAVYDNEKNFIPDKGNQSHRFYYNDTESLQYVRFTLSYSLTNLMIEELPYTNFDYWYSRDYVAYDENEIDPHASSILDYIKTAVTNNCLVEYSEFHAKALRAGTYISQSLKYFTVNAGEKYTLSIGDVISNPDAKDKVFSAITLNESNKIVRRISCSQNSKTSFTINEGELFMYVVLRLNTETPIEEGTLVTFKDVLFLKGDKRYGLHDDLLPSVSTEFLDAPQNYFMQEVEETADTILSKMDNECLVLNVLTDTHLSVDDENNIRRNKNTYENIKAVNERVYSDGIVHLGDLNLPSPKITTQFVANQLINTQRSYMAQANENVYMVIGNHDGVLGGLPVEKAVYGALSKHNEKYVTREANNDYFYADFTKLKIRCIFLATSQKISESYMFGCSATQVEWLSESLNTGDDWSVMVFSHVSPFYADRQTDPQLQSEFVNKAAVVGLLNAYDNHTQYSDGTYSADFSGYASTRIVSWVCGHAHMDYINRDNDLGCPVITLAPSGVYYPSGVVPETAIVQSRKDYDVTQDLWSTLIYRPDEDKLYVVRFGAGDDIIISL